MCRNYVSEWLKQRSPFIEKIQQFNEKDDDGDLIELTSDQYKISQGQTASSSEHDTTANYDTETHNVASHTESRVRRESESDSKSDV